MGIDIYALDFLLRFRGSPFGETLWLGRQGFHIDMKRLADDSLAASDDAAVEILRRHDAGVSVQDLVSQSGFAEKVFDFLGSRSICSLDASGYEGADIVHDLNTPVPRELYQRFDCIYDGGTLEHVYNIPAAVENIKNMLRLGGRFFSANGANNFLGHGLYQFSPDLMWRVFSPNQGFRVEVMYLCETGALPKIHFLSDPSIEGQRMETRVTRSPTYLMVAARKIAEPPQRANVYQSDYQAVWT